MHVWYVDAGIEDTPEPVYTHCLVLSCLVSPCQIKNRIKGALRRGAGTGLTGTALHRGREVGLTFDSE